MRISDWSSDVCSSDLVGVVVAGVAIGLTGLLWIDPAISLVIVAVIVWGTWGLLRESVTLSLAAVPSGIDPGAVERLLASLPGVARVHDLHLWAIITTETALTAHPLSPDGHPGATCGSQARSGGNGCVRT